MDDDELERRPLFCVGKPIIVPRPVDDRRPVSLDAAEVRLAAYRHERGDARELVLVRRVCDSSPVRLFLPTGLLVGTHTHCSALRRLHYRLVRLVREVNAASLHIGTVSWTFVGDLEFADVNVAAARHTDYSSHARQCASTMSNHEVRALEIRAYKIDNLRVRLIVRAACRETAHIVRPDGIQEFLRGHVASREFAGWLGFRVADPPQR